MTGLRFFAIAIDEVRDLFGANEETAAAFRSVAAAAFPPPKTSAPGLIGKLGPLFRRPTDAPVVRPDQPASADVDAILAGRFVQPVRLTACWRLVEAWLEARAWDVVDLPVGVRTLADLEFDLARAGLPAQFSLGKVLKRDLGVPLRPAPGLIAGHADNEHALDSIAPWQRALESLNPDHRSMAEAYLRFLEGWPDHGWAAADAGRLAPDVVALFRPDEA